ncbi:MAG: ATP-binding protein [Kiritimatiellae bacterium]|nr:ATP-binding protein [Kiritimatiellia bacterium]
MIERSQLFHAVGTALGRNPVAVLLGPRQCGKTTLARMVIRDRADVTFFDLEDPATLGSFDNPALVLRDLRGLVVIDEVQRRPDLFPLLRVLADRDPLPARFLLLGSASPSLLRQSSESLAGRVEFIEMGGFSLAEIGPEAWKKLWSRGGFPRSFLAESDPNSQSWRDQFIATFLERDIPQLGLNLPALQLRRFWSMVAHYHGASWNSSEVGGALGVADHTARRYLDILSGAYMVRILPPWFENLGKRQRKAPKVYLRDTGLLHRLLNIGEGAALFSHPKCGASWEGFALEQAARVLGLTEVYFWAVHGGAELDLFCPRNGKRYGFEFKYSDAPAITKSMREACKLLMLERLFVVYPGPREYPMADRVSAVPLSGLGAISI